MVPSSKPDTPLGAQKPETATAVLQPLPGIGDMVWHIPVLRALAASDPGGRIDLLAQEKLPLQDLLAGERSINRIFGLPPQKGVSGRIRTLRATARILRGGCYQRIFILHHSWRHALAARLAGVPRIHGFGFGAQKWLLTQGQSLPDSDRRIFPLRRSEKLLDLAGISGYEGAAHLSADDALTGLIAETYAASPKPWIAFGIGARDPMRVWPPAHFAAVADALWQAGARSLFLLGSPDERSQAEAIAAACLVAKPLTVTDRPFGQVMALISRCAFALCNDSGLMNVAAALGVPVYAPFGVAPGARAGGYDMTHVEHLQKLLAPCLRCVLPREPVSTPDDAPMTAAQVSADWMLARLAADGVLANLGARVS